MKALIFAGGSGTRLWPLSRRHNPKQFLGILDHKTMIQHCYDRITPLFEHEDIYVATGKENKEAMCAQLPQLQEDHLFIEPIRRDLGPAVGLAAALIAKISPQEPIAYIWGADQIYKDEDKYRHLLSVGQQHLIQHPSKIILLGETPRFANPNVGWVEIGSSQTELDGFTFHAFKGFKAKPPLDIAIQYYRDHKHVWNIGDFMTTPSFILSLYEQYAPDMYQKLMQIQATYQTDQFVKVLEEVYPTMDEVHHDQVIFEKMDHTSALVIAADLGYADIGAWNTYKEAFEDYHDQTVTLGKVWHTQSHDSLIYNQVDDKLIVGLDLEDMVIVNTEDVLFVGKKSSINNIKTLVKQLGESEYEDLT